MVLGIKLEIDKGSVKQASKEIRDAATSNVAKKEKSKLISAEEKRIRKQKGIKDPSDKKQKGALKGGLIGGFIGSIVASLKPIQELLGVISGILQIFMMPVLILMKPFLILFLKVGIGLAKWLSKQNRTKVQKVGNIVGGILGILAVVLLGILTSLGGWLIALIGIVVAFLGKFIVQIAVWFFENVLKPIGKFFTETLPKWISGVLEKAKEFFLKAWEFIKDVGKKIWGWIKTGFMPILDFGKRIWEFFLKGLQFIADLGVKIWNYFLDGLKSIANLGVLIWEFIKKALSRLNPFKKESSNETSANDALITSKGQIIKFHPQDNFLAFQDFSQLNNISESTGNAGRSGNTIINFPNYLGDKDELIDIISKGLSKSARGSISNF